LAGAPAGLELLTDRSRPAMQTFSGGRQDIQIPTQLYGALKSLSRDERATLFMTLLAAFKTLLHRYTGAEDLLVGTVAANRNRGETEKLIGFFANTLVLRTDFSGDPNFREVLGRVRATVLEAYAHQDLPFEKLVEELRPERNLSLSPLFQVLFTFRTAPPPVAFPGLAATLLEVETGTTKFDLSLALAEGEEGLSGVLEYNCDLFDEATMSRMLRHFHQLLESVVADPELPVARHSLLLPEEQKLLAGEWKDNRADYPRHLCMHELFEAQAAATPTAVALACGDEQLTYGELDARANQLAHHLGRLGVGPEVVAGICMERSAEMVIGLLAILKAGGVYLPLDPAYPKERLAFMLADVEARALLTQEHLTGRLPAHQATTVFLSGDGSAYAGESTLRPPRSASPQNLAYLIYTSGSTGRPKGVAIEHCNAVTLLHWARGVFSDVELSGLLAATSICFDISVFEIFAPLSWGGKVILVENVLDLLTLRQPEQVTLVNTVPSAMAELLRAKELPESVRTVNLAGEPIAAALIATLYEQKNVERVYNLYGPSEDTTYTTYALARRGSLKPPPIGRPITNTQIYLLDKQMGLSPLGVAGEVYIGGEGLSRGYYGHSDSTAKSFLPNPFSDEPGARMYRTGDLARYLPDGELEFLGRADHQVKLRGFRIELGEIETVLEAHAAVREAIVLVREDAANDKRLVAYIVARSEPPPSSELQSFLRERLPDYMVPSAFVVLDALPLLPTGKINRGALPAPAGLRAESAEAYTPPRDELEQTIAAVWQEVLHTAQVGIHDNFFSELGGHSLLAVQAVARLREHLAPQLSFVAMFQFPTISSLAGHLRSGGDWQPSSEQAEERARQRQQALRQRRHFKQAHLPMGTE
ncbi:MAG: amino acid adenylation domain-containing protein, partial [Acidobacteriota bacterium]